MHQLPAYKKTRIAPTPSGYLHPGNALSFALTASIAAQTSATLFLRIDDLDRERAAEPYIQDIFDTLTFMEISWQEGPKNATEFEERFSQLHRMQLYSAALDTLKLSGLVYACNCSRSQILRDNPDGFYKGNCRHKKIPLDEPGVCWRLNTSEEKLLVVKTLNEPSIKTSLPEEMQDFVVRKKDGFPAYQLTSLVDDLHFGVDLVVRGKDLWASTLAQLYLADVLDFLDFSKITFFHHSLVMAPDGKKLSKSAGDASLQYLRKQGYNAAEIYALLGRIHELPEPVQSLADFSAQLRF